MYNIQQRPIRKWEISIEDLIFHSTKYFIMKIYFCFLGFRTHACVLLPNQKYELQSDFRQTQVWENNNYIIVIDQQPHQTFNNISWSTLMGQLKGKFISASILAIYMVRNGVWQIVTVKSIFNFMHCLTKKSSESYPGWFWQTFCIKVR